MMLPGVELARRRRVHYHGDVVSGAGDHTAGAHSHHHGAAMAGPAMAARIRLQEKLRGAPPPSASRWSRLIRDRDGGSAASGHGTRQEQQPEEDVLATGLELWSPPPPRRDSASHQRQTATASAAKTTMTRSRRAELQRTLSKVDVCAVCLEEVRERQQRATWLPCSHKFHSECIVAWLAIQPECPCCRTRVPAPDAAPPQSS